MDSNEEGIESNDVRKQEQRSEAMLLGSQG